MKSLPFIEGFMPLQMFLEVALALGFLSLISGAIEKAGWKPNKLFQAVVLFGFCIWYLRYRIYPPLPLTVVQTYAVVAGLGIFGWVSSNEGYWQEVRQPILVMLDGATPLAWAARVLVVAALPLLVGAYVYSVMKPADVNASAPIDLRTYHPAPPRTITVYSPEDFKR